MNFIDSVKGLFRRSQPPAPSAPVSLRNRAGGMAYIKVAGMDGGKEFNGQIVETTCIAPGAYRS